MGNLETKIFRVCGSAIKQNKLDTQEMKEEEEDNVFIERNRDKYFQKGDYKKILEKFPEYKNWTEHGMNPSTDEKPKQKRIRWKQGEVIGHGSFGKVVMGLNLQTGCMMAVKQVQIGAVNTSAQQERIKALEVEIELLSQFSHKNIVRYYGSDSTKDTFNIFLEYISGGTIASLLDKYGPFNENLIRVYTRQILQGLEYLHVRNTIHRDIKGANVLVDNSGICKLTDFGTAKRISSLVESDSKYLPSIRGTVNWMAPEVIRQSNLGRYCDIWSVGCTVIEMATGKAPWATLLNSNATSVSLLYQIAQAKSPPPFPKGLSNEAIDFLKQCFRINPQERPNVIKLLNHRFLSSVVFYKHIDLPRDPKQEIAPKEALEQHIRVYSDRERTTAGEKYTLKRKASSSKEPIHHNDIDISPFKISENKNVLSQQTNSIPPSIPKKGEFYITKEEDDTPKRPVRPQQNRKIPSASEISQREDKSKVEHTELKGLAPNDLSEIESPAILHNLTDRFRSIIEEEKDKPIFRVPLDPRGNPESKVRSRPLGKNKRLLLKKGGYSNLSEDESIAGNSFMLMGSPEAIHEVNEDKAPSGGSTKGNKSSLFKAPFAWPDNLGENEHGNDEEREHIVIESDQEEDSDQETSEQAEKQRNGRKQHRKESLHNLSNTSVHSNPETHTIEEHEEKKKSIMNKENLEAEFDHLFTEQRNPLSLKSMNQIVEKKTRTDSNVARRLPNALGKVKSPIKGVRSEEEIRVVYQRPLTDLEERRNIYKGKKLEHSLAPQNLKLIDD